MLNELNNRLMELQEKLQEGNKIRRRLEEAERSFKKLKKRLCELKELLDKEKKDVDNLDGMSLANLFYSILGIKEERLREERQEYLAAKLKYDQCLDELKALEKEIHDLKLQVEEINILEREYQDVLRKKEEILEKMGDNTSRELANLSEKLARARANAKEIKEAIEVGNAAMVELEKVLRWLDSASSWSAWDMIGGGIISTAIKHSHINEARNAASQAQYHLHKLERELKDVGRFQNLDIDIGSFATFADFFFDGLIADWVVHSRIRQSQENTRQVLEEVKQVIRELSDALQETEKEIDRILYERQELVKKA
ncbi:MAG: hypothetical protein L5655_08830 [Thermosediminibacteraceae bacterium]|nr:hypothetical protein [Thermosediminibacteraceae bacterium]